MKSIYKSQNNKIIPTLIIVILLLAIPKIYLIINMVNNTITIGKTIIVILILFIQILLIVLLVKNIKDKKKYKEVITKGKKLKGKIEPIVEKVNNKEYYYLQIHFINPVVGVPTEFKTKRISVNPYTSFKSDKCNIYFYKGAVIAEDFELTDNPKESIFKEKEK